MQLYTQKHLAPYQLETVPVPIRDNNTEANFYTWLQFSEEYLATTEENYISFTFAELPSCKYIEHEYFCENYFWLNTGLLRAVNHLYVLTFHQTLLMTIVNLFSFTI